MEPQSTLFNEKLNNLSQTFYAILDDFKKYYVFYHIHPEVDEYQQYFLNNKSHLQEINKEVFLITNDIQKYLEKIDLVVSRINLQLGDEKFLNKELLQLMEKIGNSENGAEVLLSDSTSLYNNQYRKNTEIFIGILFLLYFIYRGLKNNE